MASSNHSLSPRSLAELALVISQVGPYLLDDSTYPSVGSLRTFWQSTRSLEQRWTGQLVGWTDASTQDVSLLETLAPRIFLCEAVSRLWSTILASLFNRRGKQDMTLLARNAVSGLVRTRNELLSRMLQVSNAHQDRILKLDRLRRRSERWTDLLLGPIALKSDCFEFTVDRDRARDFGEEGLLADQNSGPNAYEHLVSAGLRLTFNLHLSCESIEEPEFLELMHSILANLPHQAFHRDGTLRSRLEQRIAVSRQRLECRASLELDTGKTHAKSSNSIALGGNFFTQAPLHD